MNSYAVIFDRDPTKNYRPFHDEFVGHTMVSNWWHFIQSMYIVQTYWTEKELSQHFRNAAAAHQISDTHLVVAVNLRERQGMLVRDAWDWFKSNS